MTVTSTEPTTAGELGGLKPPHVVLSDLALPRAKARLEHLVLGPGGVFAIESKRWSSPVHVRGRAAFLGDRLLSPVLEPIARRAAAVKAALGVDVRGVLCVLSPVEPDGKKDRLLVEGVEITSLRRLTRIVTREHKAHGYEDLLRLAALAAVRLTPSGRRPCPCGGELLPRRRRSDGAVVLACSRHPVCRSAQPVG